MKLRTLYKIYKTVTFYEYIFLTYVYVQKLILNEIISKQQSGQNFIATLPTTPEHRKVLLFPDTYVFEISD